MFSYQEDLEELQNNIQQTIADISSFLPNLQSPNPASCVLIYVLTPGKASEVLGDFVFVASPADFYIAMRGREVLGGGPADLGNIRGIFPISQPDEAVSLAHSLLEDAQTPRCQKCGQPYGPDLDGSPGVLQHRLDDGSDEVDYDRDEDHAPVPEEE